MAQVVESDARIGHTIEDSLEERFVLSHVANLPDRSKKAEGPSRRALQLSRAPKRQGDTAVTG